MREITSVKWYPGYKEVKIFLEPVPQDRDHYILIEHREGRYVHKSNQIVGCRMYYWIWTPYDDEVWKCLPTELGAWRAVKAILDGKVKP